LTGRTVLAAARVDAPPGPKYAGLEGLPGHRIEAVTRRGKFLIMPLRGPASPGGAEAELIVHLGMTGVVRRTPPPGHLRVRVELDGTEPCTLYFQDVRRFGRFTVVRAGAYGGLPTLASLGPDALDPAFTASALGRALAGSGVAIKTVLLSQRAVAGVGNIYADEALWRVGVHPLRPARALTKGQVEALHGAIVGVLEESVALQGTTLYDYRTVNGEVGAFIERLAVYGHDGEPCARCGTTIEKLVVGQRGTHVCPRCQVAPRRRRAARATTRTLSRTR
jgi:formamidopyrimidine-DNA glycosylase